MLLSQSTAAVLEDDPIEGMDVCELGSHQLKDFEQPERISLISPSAVGGATPERRPAVDSGGRAHP